MAPRKDDLFGFFDPAKARGPGGESQAGRDGTDAVLAAGEGSRGPETVSLLVARVKGALAEAFPGRVAVVGEVSNFKRHTSGHLYFRLKDAGAALDAVMFRGPAGRLRFEPSDGLEVVAEGRVDVYETRGQLQLYVERMSPRGAGALELAFRQLKEKLQAEGLFDPAAKKPIPRFPGAVGVITSATGAAIRDIRRTLARRWPAARVYLLPTLVQGPAAAGQIAEAVALLDADAERLGIETILVGRGGGSLEDLWAFNEEVVARAIHAARTPIVSAVGHEVDVTIADLVADVRAATPTAGAELAVPDQADVADRLAAMALQIGRRVRQRLDAARLALEAVYRSAVFRDPTGRLRTGIQRLDELSYRLRAGAREGVAAGRRAMEAPAGRLAGLHPARLAEQAAARVDRFENRLAWALGGRSKRAGDALNALAQRMTAADPVHALKLARQAVDAAARQLEAMSYRRVLRRGFSVTRGGAGRILRSAKAAGPGQRIETELVDGTVRSVVEGGPPARPKPRTRPRKKNTNHGLPLFGPDSG